MMGNPLEATRLKQHQAQAVDLVDRYWHRMASGGHIPTRAQIDPAQMQDALEYAFVAEHMSGGIVRMRIAGGSLKAVMGMEVAGMPAATLIHPKERATFNDAVLKVLQTPTTARVSLCAAAKYGQPGMEADLRLYPLRGIDGEITQVLGTFITTGRIGQTPRRFAMTQVDYEPVLLRPESVSQPILTRGHLSLVVSH